MDCKPKDFSYKDGWLPLYTRAGITKHLSGLESLLNKDKTSPLIAVILPEMDFQYEQEYVIHKLHKSESLNRISISYDTNQRKQITFCPYCGVMNENMATALSQCEEAPRDSLPQRRLLQQDLQETTVLVQPHVVLPANRDPPEGEGFPEE